MRCKEVFRYNRQRVVGALAVLLFVIVVAAVNGEFSRRREIMFVVRPSRIEQCSQPRVVADVRWVMPRGQSAIIYIYMVGQSPIPWHGATGRGEAKTGDWVADGTTIALTAADGTVLAKHTMTSVSCI